MSLKGRTIVITGASRGIGKAIALRAARDGANIAILAKTTEAHAKLPGTIFSAAEEIEKAGGHALPISCDIRYEDQVERAIQQTVDKFGGIDILVNNASAISLTGTLETPLKKYDLMMGINARGTFVASQAALPHLKRSTNPHILNISPPLNMSPRWFGPHVAYTSAKYGMSLCVLGMADEFAGDGIAVNALWPRTGIATAAIANHLGGNEAMKQCRTPEIMADAAYSILVSPSREVTGNFFLDDEILLGQGVSLSQYACVPGTPDSDLMLDFFLDTREPRATGSISSVRRQSDPVRGATLGGNPLELAFSEIGRRIQEKATQLKKINAVVRFEVQGKDALAYWTLNMKGDTPSFARESSPSKADLIMSATENDFLSIISGKMTPANAWIEKKLKIKGDISLANTIAGLVRVGAPRL